MYDFALINDMSCVQDAWTLAQTCAWFKRKLLRYIYFISYMINYRTTYKDKEYIALTDLHQLDLSMSQRPNSFYVFRKSESASHKHDLSTMSIGSIAGSCTKKRGSQSACEVHGQNQSITLPPAPLSASEFGIWVMPTRMSYRIGS